MRVLVSGDRNYTHRWTVYGMLAGLWDRWSFGDKTDPFIVTEGKCPKGGADLFAEEWARANKGNGCEHDQHPADWANLPRWEAGPARNQEMVDTHPDVVIAFKDDFDFTLKKGGTEDCCRRALDADIPVYVVSKLQKG